MASSITPGRPERWFAETMSEIPLTGGSIMSRLFRNLRQLFQGPPYQRPLPSRRPALEALEDRSLPSTLFFQTNLVSDLRGMARFTDKNLVNPWGLVLNSVAPFAIADNGAGVATFHQHSGKSLRVVVK